MKSNEPLSSAHLSFQCPMRLEDFSNHGAAYYCGECKREILDLTDCTIEDAIKLYEICLKLYNRDNNVHYRLISILHDTGQFERSLPFIEMAKEDDLGMNILNP